MFGVPNKHYDANKIVQQFLVDNEEDLHRFDKKLVEKLGWKIYQQVAWQTYQSFLVDNKYLFILQFCLLIILQHGKLPTGLSPTNWTIYWFYTIQKQK